MIIAKTEMDKMPERCGQCECFQLVYDSKGEADGDGRCALITTVRYPMYSLRPSWCPLMEVEETKEVNND